MNFVGPAVVCDGHSSEEPLGVRHTQTRGSPGWSSASLVSGDTVLAPGACPCVVLPAGQVLQQVSTCARVPQTAGQKGGPPLSRKG